jgi:hypothetical protein
MFGAVQAKGGGTSHFGPAKSHNTMAPIGFAESVYNFDVAGIYSNDEYGSPVNEVFNIDVGANAWVTGIGWDVSIYADSPSWLSEMTVAFEDSALSTGVFLTVGVGDDFSGAGAYSSGGIVDLVGLGLQFQVGADGKLRMEFFEDYDDFEGDWDGIWESGALSVQVMTPAVPEPTTYALMLLGLAAVAGVARRRR